MARREVPPPVQCGRSPRTRGDGPLVSCSAWSVLTVLPAHAGMARLACPRPWCRPSSPRTRGDGPQGQLDALVRDRFSPHTRGWPVIDARLIYQRRRSPRTRGDGPLEEAIRRAVQERSPRTRGDGPAVLRLLLRKASRSPRTRGDGPPGTSLPACEPRVLPAHAGMARQAPPAAGPGRPFSPHTRGWPGGNRDGAPRQCVLPAHAGMALSLGRFRRQVQRSPRTRGDGPQDISRAYIAPDVLPAHAGMARREGIRSRLHLRSPRTRGDGPVRVAVVLVLTAFSPHTRGWPAASRPTPVDRSVLPAHAGMARQCCYLPAHLRSVLPAHAGMARLTVAL